MEKATNLACLVLEGSAVVAEDLAAMVRDAVPDAKILVASSVSRASEILSEERVDIAFVNLAPMALAHTDLVRKLEEMEVTVVLMRFTPPEPTQRFRFLEVPFAPSAVADELRAVMRRKSRGKDA